MDAEEEKDHHKNMSEEPLPPPAPLPTKDDDDDGKDEEESSTILINQTCQCLCGNIKFRIKGKMVFNELCHCRACAYAASVTPVQVAHDSVKARSAIPHRPIALH